MNPQEIMNLALIALNGVLSLISKIRGQGGLTDDQILAQANTVAAGNDEAYAAIVKALDISVPPTAL